MARSKKKREFPLAEEANLIPVLSCMFLLIPSLLLAMEVASWAALPISPPHVSSQPADPGTQTERFEFRVSVRSDGFESTVGVRSADPQRRVFGMLEGASGERDKYDYAALADLASTAKDLFPAQATVYVTAEGDVPLKVLVNAMDALRGDGCSLAAIHESTEAPAECLFWNVVVEG